MIPSLIKSPHFIQEVERLNKKYHHIKEDLNAFYEEFLKKPLIGAFAIPGFERKLWKIRLGSTDQQKGKRGGFRIVFYFDESKPNTVHALTIYPKNEREDISSKDLWELYKRFLEPLLKKRV